ncbi:hypothetical protein EG68_02627 [Paragonimus skrjabini miyazakii]|uniref:Uncharacterized protein n=1 Tax=Paragonimus skrjabini miyazakii TaxID=59628 RepID=A0A8S9Z0B3_9TREM|nr:hypothetical protein EG68_02627 [Paragonimus skrjabini miyazakii]
MEIYLNTEAPKKYRRCNRLVVETNQDYYWNSVSEERCPPVSPRHPKVGPTFRLFRDHHFMYKLKRNERGGNSFEDRWNLLPKNYSAKHQLIFFNDCITAELDSNRKQ